ncbi:hypothetical protein [Streptomyces massasporeus]|uniref:hypothetical protein n=1 Tax=Streptomyces massasporeus TaxID=67324 RepID=UPI0033CEE6AD
MRGAHKGGRAGQIAVRGDGLTAQFDPAEVSAAQLHAGDDEYLRLRPTQVYGGHPVSYESHLLPAERIAELLSRAGLVITTRLVQEPDEGARRAVATFRARKPERPLAP